MFGGGRRSGAAAATEGAKQLRLSDIGAQPGDPAANPSNGVLNGGAGIVVTDPQGLPANSQVLTPAQSAGEVQNNPEGNKDTSKQLEDLNESTGHGVESAKQTSEADAGTSSTDPNTNPPPGTDSKPGRLQEVLDFLPDSIKTKTGGLFILGGLSVVAWAMHLGILTDQNNGAKIKVTNILVEESGSTGKKKVTITYDPNDAKTRNDIKISPLYVKPSIGDFIDEVDYIGRSQKHKIKKAYDGNKIELEILDTFLDPNLPNVLSGTCEGSTNRDCYNKSRLPYNLDVNDEDVYMKLHTKFSHQMVQSSAEVLRDAADILKILLQEATDTATDTFCEILPDFVCDTKTWLIVGGVILGLFILFILLQVVNRKK